MRSRRSVAIFVLLLPALGGAGTSNARAAVYHVSPTGRANGAGTVESPWSLTKANHAVQPVDDARFFTDGYGIIEPDRIRVDGMRVAIEAVDYQTNRIRLADEISWPAGAPVSLDYEGDGPDIGAFEFGSAEASNARYGADHPAGR